MKNHVIKLIMLNIILGITITSCGGEEESVVSEENLPIKVVSQQETEATIATSELISEADFNFISTVDLEVIIPASPSTSVGYFINICTDFSKVNDKAKINYDSCKLRATLHTSEQLFTLSLSNVELALVAQIWPIAEGAQPVTIYWNITESSTRWNIAI